MTNQLEKQRTRADMPIPVGMATAIVKDNALLKPLSVYFELKPLYYSGVIVNSKKRYREIAGFLCICESNLRSKLRILKKMGLAWHDHKDNLYFASLDKVCRLVKNKTEAKLNYHRTHHIRNTGNTEMLLRQLVVSESLQRQNDAIENKIFTHEKYRDKCFQHLLNNAVSPHPAWDRYHVDIMKHLFHNKHLQKQKRMYLSNYEDLVSKYREMYLQARFDNKKPIVDPTATLSCAGMARVFGLQSKSTGYYWEKRLQAEGLLEIKNRCERIPKNSVLNNPYIETEGVFTRVHTRKKLSINKFLTLANLIIPKDVALN